MPKQTENVCMCPVCEGTGHIMPPKTVPDFDDMVQVLVNAGYSYRQICALCKIKTPNTIMNAVKRNREKKIKYTKARAAAFFKLEKEGL